MKLRICTIAAIALAAAPLFGQATEDEGYEPARDHARSVVATRYGIVATSQTLASAAGVKILEGGGHAVDAAIAANAVMGLVEPTGNGIGGDLFAIIWDNKSGKLYGLNASGWAPSGLTPDFLAGKGHSGKMPNRGIYSVTVPGAVAGWDAMHKRFGRLRWVDLFTPAIHYAQEGFPVTEVTAALWGSDRGRATLEFHPNAAKLYLPNGKAPAAGEIFQNPELANSLRDIAAHGRKAFYEGDIAQKILAISKELDGTITADDLKEFQPEWVTPISTTYRGWTVSELPPNGMGIGALMMLNILERYPLADWGHNSANTLHAMIEAKKLAYADLLRYVGDPKFGNVPVKQMLAREFAAARAGLINADKASCATTPAQLASLAALPGADTIYLSVIDRDGNMVSLIQSNYQGFGSGIVPPGAGFMLQNRGALFSLSPKQPNTLAPRKRPLHTIIPGFMAKEHTRIAFGIMGGWNQAQAHAQFVVNVADFGMNVQQALEAPRFTKQTFDGCEVSLESRIAPEVRAELEKRGHVLKMIGPYGQRVGGGQAVMSTATGVHFGGSDPRKDGAALPESPKFNSGGVPTR